MAFDIHLAIAKLGGVHSHSVSDLATLRDKYPELSFIFDELEELREHFDDSVSADDYRYINNDNETLRETLSDAKCELYRITSEMAEVIECRAEKGKDVFDYECNLEDLNENLVPILGRVET